MLITKELMMDWEQDSLAEKAKLLQKEDIENLVEWLSLKEDDIRYRAFLLLQEKSRLDSDVYPYWDVFHLKLKNENSYQRSLGVMLIAENVQWDAEHKMKDTLPDFLNILKDEKMITVRQCIQALTLIVEKVPEYRKDIAEALLSYDVMSVRESMKKLILTDILNALIGIRKHCSCSEIDRYIMAALTGEILDKKSKKAIEKLL